jgi:hypothetical protein
MKKSQGMYIPVFFRKMSAKKTADAALAVAEEALNRVYALQRGNPALLLAVVVILGYLFYINHYVLDNPQKSQYILNMYHNRHARAAIITVIVLGMSGVFGPGFTHLSTILGFAFVASYVTIRHLKEGMEDAPKGKLDVGSMNSKQMNDLTAKLNHITNQLNSRKAGKEKEKVEKMTNFPSSRSGSRCTPCPGGSRQPFNPRPYEPKSRLMGIGNDRLPPMGVDFLSAPSGVFTQSQIGYQFGFT